MWPLGTLITKKGASPVFNSANLDGKEQLANYFWTSHLNVSPALKTFVRNMLVFNWLHHLNPYLFMSLVSKRTMSYVDMNFEAMWFALKVGEQNKGPLNWLLMWKHWWGPHQNKQIITPLLSRPQPVTSLSNASQKVKLFQRELRYLFQAKLAPESLLMFDLTGHSGIKCRTCASLLYAAHWLAYTAACLKLSGPMDKCTSSNYVRSTVWRFVFTAVSFQEVKLPKAGDKCCIRVQTSTIKAVQQRNSFYLISLHTIHSAVISGSGEGVVIRCWP